MKFDINIDHVYLEEKESLLIKTKKYIFHVRNIDDLNLQLVRIKPNA
jgi:hypothetical protein